MTDIIAGRIACEAFNAPFDPDESSEERWEAVAAAVAAPHRVRIDELEREHDRLAAERDRYAAQLAVITVALRDIADSYDTGTMAHDVAHAALEALGDTGRTRSAADLAAALREIDAVCREDPMPVRACIRIATIARAALGRATSAGES